MIDESMKPSDYYPSFFAEWFFRSLSGSKNIEDRNILETTWLGALAVGSLVLAGLVWIVIKASAASGRVLAWSFENLPGAGLVMGFALSLWMGYAAQSHSVAQRPRETVMDLVAYGLVLVVLAVIASGLGLKASKRVIWVNCAGIVISTGVGACAMFIWAARLL